MNWLSSLLFESGSFSHGILAFSIAISLGLYLGKLKFFGLSFGATCVLFVGLIMSWLGIEVDASMLGFFRNFGLILFVFFIGLQVGPSFFATFKSSGAGLVGLMVLAVGLSLAVTVILYFLCAPAVSLPEMLGIMFGAVTSTPGLGATQEALQSLGSKIDITVGYACAYPFAILSTMAVIMGLKRFFNVDLAEEDKKWDLAQQNMNRAPIFYHVKANNKALSGITLREIRAIIGRPFICSRVLHDGTITSPTADSLIYVGDRLRIVSNSEHKTAVCAFCGEEDKEVDLATAHSPIKNERIRVTEPNMQGVQIEDLHLSRFDGVNITRVARAGVTFFPYNSLRLQLGDTLICVGPANAISRLAALVGNREKQLEKPNVIAIFAAIAFGVLLGSVPIAFPYMPVTIKLGLAGGPLIAAILLGYYGPRFHLVTYTTHSANLMLRQWGQTFFLASVGLASGKPFFEAFINGSGYLYVLLGIPITVIPLAIAGFIARTKMNMNFHSIAGFLAGCTTNTSLLGFASSLSERSIALISYSTVYPLAMFLRIISGQVLLMILWAA